MVITFADISEIKAAEREIQAARAYSDSIIDTIRQPLVVLDEELRVVSANRSFYRSFALTREETVGKPLGFVENGDLGGPGLRGFVDRVQVEQPVPVEDYEVDTELPLLGRRLLLLLIARKILDGLLGGL